MKPSPQEPGTAARPGPTRRLFEIAPVLLLVGVASLHAVRAGIGSLRPPDKSGGFGLFSTVDRLNNRLLAATLEEAAGARPLDLSVLGPRDERVRRALAAPSDETLLRVARALGDAGAWGTGPGSSLTVEVSKLAFDPETARVRLELLHAVTQRAGD